MAALTLIAVCVSLYTLWRQRTDTSIRERRAQANLVSVWYEEGRDLLHVENRSEHPIHDVSLVLVPSKLNEPLSASLHSTGGMFPILPPRHRLVLAPWVSTTMKVPTLVFRDAQGVTWKRDNQSDLVELDQDVFAHYGLGSREGYNYLMDRPVPL